MGQKAWFREVIAISQPYLPAQDWRLEATFNVSDGIGGCVVVGALAECPTFHPAILTPPWKQRLVTSVVANALALYGITVDEVVFADFSIL